MHTVSAWDAYSSIMMQIMQYDQDCFLEVGDQLNAVVPKDFDFQGTHYGTCTHRHTL